MNFSNGEGRPVEGEEAIVALNLARVLALPMVLKSVVELNIFEIMVAAGDDAWLSTSEIASQLPTRNPDAAAMLDRMLGLLGCYSLVKCKLKAGEHGEVDGHERRLYGVTPTCKLFTENGGESVRPFLMSSFEMSRIESWCHLSDGVLQGGTPYVIAHGMPMYRYHQGNEHLNQLFNQAMYNQTSLVMRKIVHTYKGFEGLNVLVDVGGGSGATLSIITSKYPNIKAINFDLPQAIEEAHAFPGVEHVGGDMFERVPSGDAIFLKSILHNWSDENCLRLLKNCNHALRDDGIVIVVEAILPATPNKDLRSIFAYHQDLSMLAHTGGKERTQQEYETLAQKSGFSSCKVMSEAYGFYVMEIRKNVN